MPIVEPALAVRNTLYANWTITNPDNDPSVQETFNPNFVSFTTQYYTPSPRRIHSFQISVMSSPNRARMTPEEVGSIVMYRVEQEMLCHCWAIPGIGGDYSTYEQYIQNMQDTVDQILRIKSTAEVGQGIQFIRDSPGWSNEDEFQNRLLFHRVLHFTAVYYRTDTSLPATSGLWGTGIWGSFNWG